MIHATTILAVRHQGRTVLGGDGQVTLGNAVLKHGARKIRRLYGDKILAGFAGSAADSFALFSRFESKLEQYRGNVERAAVELARDWRTDRLLRRLEAMLIVADREHTFVLSGTGDLIEPDDGVVAANVPISNASTGIEVNGARVAVTGNAVNASPVGIRLGDAAAACTVVGNTVHGAKEAPLVLGGRGHRARDNSGASLEVGPGAAYGGGELEVTAARTPVTARFADDRYLVSIEWVGDPGGREWIADRTAAGFVITLPAAPPRPVRARWLALGTPPRD